MQRLNAFTVDVEDGVNQAMRNIFSVNIEPTIRVYNNCMSLLDILSEYETKATFFILGEVAKTFPSLVKIISDQGHELAIHGYSHTRYSRLSKGELNNEIIRSKRLVEDISGIEVVGHRAPGFCINNENLWVLELLLNAGIKYDSSISPARLPRAVRPHFKKNIDWFRLDDQQKIIEAPITSVNYLGKEFTVCGGSYLRVFPYFVTNHVFQKVLKSRPVNVYLHPYELDIPPFEQFYMDAVNNASLKKQFQVKALWYNRKSMIPKLRSLLSMYKFSTLNNVIKIVLKTEF
jgi:polysaccharide deacetylase family protein (PEP-CTERM system associated)